jgi:hypothetical protein
MLMLELTRVVQDDREREIRRRLPRVAGISSARRHPLQPETSAVDEAIAATPPARALRTRPAYGT